MEKDKIDQISVVEIEETLVGVYASYEQAQMLYERRAGDVKACAEGKGPDGCAACVLARACEKRRVAAATQGDAIKKGVDCMAGLKVLARKYCALRGFEYETFMPLRAAAWDSENESGEREEAARGKDGGDGRG